MMPITTPKEVQAYADASKSLEDARKTSKGPINQSGHSPCYTYSSFFDRVRAKEDAMQEAGGRPVREKVQERSLLGLPKTGYWYFDKETAKNESR